MSDLKGFFGRWSRRKRAAEVVRQSTDKLGAPPLPVGESVGARGAHSFERPEPLTPPLSQRERGHTASADSASPRPPRTADSVFDLTQLPPIESITAVSDIRPFLAAGVPVEITRAALRRAWSADPKIRDFVGLAENSWDFNAAGAIPGFGPLEMTEDLRRHVAQLISREVAGAGTERSESPRPEAPDQCAAAGKPAILNAADADPRPRPSVDDAGTWRSRPPLSEEGPGCDPNARCPIEDEAERRSTVRSSTKRPHGRALPK